jgi:hypothetical protein
MLCGRGIRLSQPRQTESSLIGPELMALIINGRNVRVVRNENDVGTLESVLLCVLIEHLADRRIGHQSEVPGLDSSGFLAACVNISIPGK